MGLLLIALALLFIASEAARFIFELIIGFMVLVACFAVALGFALAWLIIALTLALAGEIWVSCRQFLSESKARRQALRRR